MVGPLWVDHTSFDVAEPVVAHQGRGPLTRDDLLDLAAELVADPLPLDRPSTARAPTPATMACCTSVPPITAAITGSESTVACAE